MRDVTSGKLEGDKIGSTSVSLHPGSIGSGIFLADTHTAGWDMFIRIIAWQVFCNMEFCKKDEKDGN